MAVGRVNGVAVLTRSSYKKMYGRFLNTELVVSFKGM